MLSANRGNMRTKICAIRSCKYSIGTRDGIQMFLVPTEELRLKEWCDAAGLDDGKILRGMVCIEHFTQEDLIPATSNKKSRLKQNAKPTIFYEMNNNIVQSKNDCSCTAIVCIELQKKYDDLTKECFDIKANYGVEILKLESKVKYLEEKMKNQYIELKSLRSSKECAIANIDELKSVNKKILSENEHNKKSVDVWQVGFLRH